MGLGNPISASYVFPGPAVVAEGRPVVVILGVAPDVHHAVVHAAAAEVLAPGPAAGAAGRQAGVALVRRPVLPVDLRAEEHGHHAGDVGARWLVGTGLHQQHLPVGHLAEPRGHHRPGRAACGTERPWLGWG